MSSAPSQDSEPSDGNGHARTSRWFLLTGVTGNLGFAVLREILERTDYFVTALVRNRGAEVTHAALAAVGLPSEPARVCFIEGDLSGVCSLDPSDPRLARVTDIMHAAADVRWYGEPAALLATNLVGTRNVLDLAEALQRRRSLERVTVVSSAYVSGVCDTLVLERPFAPPGFNNPYEASKFLMEREALGRRGLPLNIVRPSAMVGDTRDGVIQNFSTLYLPLRLVFENRLPMLPGLADGRIDAIPCNYAARLVLRLHETRYGPGEVVHACAGERAISLEDLWGLACAAFDRLAPGPRPRRPGRFVSPRLANVAQAVAPLLPLRTRKQLRRLTLYRPYLCMRRTFESRKTAALGLPPPPALAEYLETICRYAVHNGFADARERFGTEQAVELDARRLAFPFRTDLLVAPPRSRPVEGMTSWLS
jgi:nucleoside-diphosphate-sugar epimerase